MTFKLHGTDTDDFNDVGDGKRVDGELWYRKDLGQIRACILGKIVVLAMIDPNNILGKVVDVANKPRPPIDKVQ